MSAIPDRYIHMLLAEEKTILQKVWDLLTSLLRSSVSNQKCTVLVLQPFEMMYFILAYMYWLCIQKMHIFLTFLFSSQWVNTIMSSRVNVPDLHLGMYSMVTWQLRIDWLYLAWDSINNKQWWWHNTVIIGNPVRKWYFSAVYQVFTLKI